MKKKPFLPIHLGGKEIVRLTINLKIKPIIHGHSYI